MKTQAVLEQAHQELMQQLKHKYKLKKDFFERITPLCKTIFSIEISEDKREDLITCLYDTCQNQVSIELQAQQAEVVCQELKKDLHALVNGVSSARHALIEMEQNMQRQKYQIELIKLERPELLH